MTPHTMRFLCTNTNNDSHDTQSSFLYLSNSNNNIWYQRGINCPFNVKELEAQANKKKRMMSNTNESPRPRTPSPSPRTTVQSIQEETLSTSDYTTPTPICSMILAQLYHSSRRSRHDSPQHKTSDVISISSIDPLPPLFELSACNDQEKIWKEMEIAISNTNADEWSFCSTFRSTTIRQELPKAAWLL